MTQNNSKEHKKTLTSLCINEFKSNYKAFTIDTLTPTLPTSLKNVNLSDKQMSQLSFNPILLSILCGAIFGDGSLQIDSGYANARLQYRHSTRQTEWFMWKSLYIFNVFTNQENPRGGIHFQEPDGHQRREGIGGELLGKWRFGSNVDTELTRLYHILCPSGRKEYQRSWLNHMNNYFLMTLWLDDGSLNNARQGVISCNSTPLKEAQILAKYIKTVWGVNCTARVVPSKETATNKEPVNITIDDFDNLEKWLCIIAPIVPVRSMLYKVCLYSSDASFLQRWISYLKKVLPPSWHNDIDKYYAYLGSIKPE